MELDWSEQSPHIRSLFHPWQPGDGYDEATIAAAEARLGVRLPKTLRNFYLAWGKREDMTPLLDPHQLIKGAAGVLILCEETQAVCYWGIRHEDTGADDPPVVITYSKGVIGWELESELEWMPSHAHLSSFLDDLLYFRAFGPFGAIHGGRTGFDTPPLPAHHISWLEENWNKAIVSGLAFGLSGNHLPTLYVRDGQAFWDGVMAAREAEALDEISQRFEITWKHRW